LDRLRASPRPAGATAIIDGEVRLDSAEAERRVAAVSGGMRAFGIRKGDVVAWQLPNWWEAIILYRACWRCGAVAAPIHHQVGAAEVGSMLESLEPALTLASKGMPLADVNGTITVRQGDPRFEELLSGRPLRIGMARGTDVAVVLFTTGSTGRPKAVLHTHQGLAYKARSMARAHGLTGADTALMPSPLAHVSGLLNSVLVPGATAMPVVMMEKWDPERGVRLVREHAVTFMIGPPTLFLGMMDVAGHRSRVASLRLVSCGGMGVTPEFIERARDHLGATVKRTYGSTEAPTVTTCTAVDNEEKARDTDGRSVGEAVIRVVAPGTTRDVTPGGKGEVILRGPELFIGYGEASQTQEAVRLGWFSTGDLGTLDAEGWLTIVGRVKDIIIRAGENIASAEVERLLELHPGVRQAVVVGCPDERVGERVVAFVVGDDRLDVEECRRWFAERGVARFKTPESVVHVEEIPLLGIGKPDRSSLRQKASSLTSPGP
ncbi:MAG: class I adenylate-forming enzyme family protein, partial [Acidimicrobiales bacterium]